MAAILRVRNPARILSFAFCLTLSLYIYMTTDSKLLLTHLNQLSIEVERRILWWDWQDTPEEVFCRNPPEISLKDRIPNVVHFILLADQGEEVELSYARFLAIKAAILRMEGATIKIHTSGINRSNQWWKELKDHVTVVTIDRNNLHTSYGLSIKGLRLPHQADILRLEIMASQGGIYMDTDVYALKPFTEILNSPRDVVMGHEGGNRYGLCNAVIISRANSEFITKWQKSYKTFNPKTWNEHSVRKPKRLQVEYPDLICPLSPTVFFWPTWAKVHVRYMHEPISLYEVAGLRSNMTAFGGAMYENQLAFHAVAATDYLPLLTPDDVLHKDTRFNVLLRDVASASL